VKPIFVAWACYGWLPSAMREFSSFCDSSRVERENILRNMEISCAEG